MDYEIMMNGNVRIGQRAPDFEATTTMGNMKKSDMAWFLSIDKLI